LISVRELIMTACLVMATGNANAQWTGGVEAGASIGSDQRDDTEAFLFLGSSVSSSLLALLRFDASASSKISNDTATIDAEVGLSVPIAPNTQLRYVYRVTRYNFDNRENIVDEDNFFTVSYGF